MLPTFEIGMLVVTPCSGILSLTEDKTYIVLDVQEEWLQIVDDQNDMRYYRSHLFIEADVYYNMILYLTLIRLFEINPNQLK